MACLAPSRLRLLARSWNRRVVYIGTKAFARRIHTQAGYSPAGWEVRRAVPRGAVPGPVKTDSNAIPKSAAGRKQGTPSDSRSKKHEMRRNVKAFARPFIVLGAGDVAKLYTAVVR